MNVALIVGCARSGTSILGELVAAHPMVKYFFELHTLWEVAGTGEDASHRLTRENVTYPVKKAIRLWFRQNSPADKLVVEKNPRNVLRVPYVHDILPEAKLLHIVRDGRDVACSMVPGCGRDEWKHLKPPSWNRWFNDYSGVVRCAHVWKEVIEIARADLQEVEHLQVRYEDLIATPEKIAEAVCQFLGLPFDPAVRAFCTKVQDKTEDSYHAKYQDHWFRPNHEARIGRWRGNMTEAEQDEVNGLLGPLLRELGYA